MTIRDTIKNLAAEHNETIAELERKLDFGNGTIARWDHRSPSSSKLAKVADHYHVSVDYILGREASPQAEQDLDKLLDQAHSFDGKPMDDHDRNLIKSIIRGYYSGKKA